MILNRPPKLREKAFHFEVFPRVLTELCHFVLVPLVERQTKQTAVAFSGGNSWRSNRSISRVLKFRDLSVPYQSGQIASVIDDLRTTFCRFANNPGLSRAAGVGLERQ